MAKPRRCRAATKIVPKATPAPAKAIRKDAFSQWALDQMKQFAESLRKTPRKKEDGR